MRTPSHILPLTLKILLGVGLLTAGTGCGALGALTNPKAAFAINEPAPMSVVVRRAEVAHMTAAQVERLLGNTPIDDKSAWTPKTALKLDGAQATLKERGGDGVYAGTMKVRIVSAEAWLDTLGPICSSETQYPSLLASVSPALAQSYGEVAAQQKEIAELKAKVAAESAAIDDKAQAAEKPAHEAAKTALEAQVDKAEEAAKPKVEAFLDGLKAEAAKATPDAKARVAVAVINLGRAVEDAKLANSVALVRYPMAMPGMKDDVQNAAKRIAADVIEEKTGARPEVAKLKLDVALDGASVSLKITGGAEGVPVDELVAETTKRTKDYVGRVLTLVGYAGETQELLSFEGKVLSSLSDGMQLGTPGADAGADIGDLKLEVTPGAKSKHREGTHTGTGLVASAACTVAAPAVAAAPVKEPVVAVVKEKPGKAAKVLVAAPKPASAPPPAALAASAAPAKAVHAAVAIAPAPKPAVVEKPAKGGDCDVKISNGNDGAKLCL